MNNHEIFVWELIEKYFKENSHFLVKHHLTSYDDFVWNGIPKIMRENNPIKIVKEQDENTGEYTLQCFLYLGGKEGNKIYYGKPIIYNDISEETRQDYMYPNLARLNNMTYSFTIHYDVDVEYVMIDDNGNKTTHQETLEHIYLGRFPIMLHSKMCILSSLDEHTRFQLGECKTDQGGYFIINGKEKVIVSQEKFADNLLKITDDFNELYSHSVDIRTVAEDPSKPVRTLSVRIVRPTPTKTNGQIVVLVPNVRKPIPLFILMRALGIQSDKKIIETCLLDMEKYNHYIDLFTSSVYDSSKIFTQENALQYISTFTKSKTISGTLHILMDYFLPNVGELNFIDKAYYLGYMVMRLLRVYIGDEKPTDRDNFKFKRVELSGSLLYDLFIEYYKLQLKDIFVKIDSEYYYHKDTYQNNFTSLIINNYKDFFSNRMVEDGIMKGFKGNWGSVSHTKREGIVQDLNRLSYFSFVSHLRKLNLPLDRTAKVVGPRLLHSSQIGIICPIHTPDGANIGLHKHLSCMADISPDCSSSVFVSWLRERNLQFINEVSPLELSSFTKVFVNGSWMGIVKNPKEIIEDFKLYRRNSLLPSYTSIRWDYQHNEIIIHSDGGRLLRPLFYVKKDGSISYQNSFFEDVSSDSLSWKQITKGFHHGEKKTKKEECMIYNPKNLYDIPDDYENVKQYLEKNACVIEYLDTEEVESSLISMEHEYDSKYTTHIEIHPSLLLSVLGNMVVYPENNQLPRDLFSCGQSKQAVSIYHTNYQNRIDKMGVVLNYGEIPLIKSKYYDYITQNQHPYGENAIVAIMSYNGYNVEDALIFNKSSVERGLFRTTYFNMYESYEESSKVSGSNVDSHFCNIESRMSNMVGLKPGYDYSHLDENGMIRENEFMDDKKVVIGKCTVSLTEPNTFIDSSVVPKKGQLGIVDKTYITEGEEGNRIAKVRIREERLPSIGDKFCSRAGQKGTVGIILDEEDMPFTKDGIRPDVIVNPHALPSRMTIGQLVECLVGKACLHYGAFGDCTAFVNKGSKHEVFGSMLQQQGFHSSGNEILYNGMNGEVLESDIFIGPTYYLRLKHMVKDKINYRARGPRTQLTRQTIGGRAKDGGLRIGEMERDALLCHGMSSFLNESMLVRGDEYYMAVCNNTGSIAIYNESKNIFLSPMVDGPIRFKGVLDNNMQIENKSVHGRDFSIVRVPYSFKLLMQELNSMNITMRIITDKNIDQTTSILPNKNRIELNTGRETYNELSNDYSIHTQQTLEQSYRQFSKNILNKEIDDVRIRERTLDPERELGIDIQEGPTTPPYEPISPPYEPTSSLPEDYQPRSPDYEPISPLPEDYQPRSPDYEPGTLQTQLEPIVESDLKEKINFDELNQEEKVELLDTIETLNSLLGFTNPTSYEELPLESKLESIFKPEIITMIRQQLQVNNIDNYQNFANVFMNVDELNNYIRHIQENPIRIYLTLEQLELYQEKLMSGMSGGRLSNKDTSTREKEEITLLFDIQDDEKKEDNVEEEEEEFNKLKINKNVEKKMISIDNI